MDTKPHRIERDFDPADEKREKPARIRKYREAPKLEPEKPESPPQGSLLAYPKRHPYVTAATALVLLLIAAAVVTWWLNARQYEWTDDAFIDARSITIGAEIAGRITEVAVTDNQPVEAGSVLLRIDD